MSLKSNAASAARHVGRSAARVLAFLWSVAAPFAAFIAMVAIWVVDATQLNWGFDENLKLIKWISTKWDALNKAEQFLPWLRPGQVEAAARGFSGEKVLLSIELGLIIRFVPMWGVWAIWKFLRLCWWALCRLFAKKASPAAAPAPSNLVRLPRRA